LPARTRTRERRSLGELCFQVLLPDLGVGFRANRSIINDDGGAGGSRAEREGQ